MTPEEFADLPEHRLFSLVEVSPGYAIPIYAPVRVRQISDDEPLFYWIDGERWHLVERMDGTLARARL